MFFFFNNQLCDIENLVIFFPKTFSKISQIYTKKSLEMHNVFFNNQLCDIRKFGDFFSQNNLAKLVKFTLKKSLQKHNDFFFNNRLCDIGKFGDFFFPKKFSKISQIYTRKSLQMHNGCAIILPLLGTHMSDCEFFSIR
jgi:hypothetical protein